MFQRSPTLLAALLLLALAAPARAQQGADASQQLRVFLECGPCDFDFQRTEIGYVSWMRDRADADLHILWRGQPTGGGGSRHTLDFIGLQTFAGKADTLVFVQVRDDTPDEVRRGLNRVIEMGLMRYVASTPIASQIQISGPSTSPASGAGAVATPPVQARDPWNFWVFSINANGNTNGESSNTNLNVNANVSANRTTADWKINLSTGGNYGRQTNQLSSGKNVSLRRSYNVNGMIVKSVNGHTSMGVRAHAGHSTFGNNDLALNLEPAVEYNMFPYAESTRRQLLVTYSAGVRHQSYEEETIYSLTEETRPTHSLSTSFSTRQTWGNVNFSVGGSQYLHDTSKYNVNFFSGFSVNVARGLRVNMNGNYSMIRDQLNIAKGNLTDEQILLREQQVATNYRYFVSGGLSYRFGSAVQNVVNPRFGGGGGEMMMIMF